MLVKGTLAMKKLAALTLTGFLLAPAMVGAQEGNDQQISPPPIASANIYDASHQYDLRVMYMDMGFVDGGGFNFTETQGFTEWFGLVASVGLMYFTGTMDTWGSGYDIQILTVPIGVVAVFEVLGGNDMDAAGQITQYRPTLALFAGPQVMLSTTTMEYDTWYGTRTDSDTDAFGFGQVGAVGEIPLASWVSIMPYGNVMFGETEIVSYGADILVRPFRNAPDWQISCGTVLQQIESNDDDSTMIMFGVSHVQTKNRSRLQIGPVLR